MFISTISMCSIYPFVKKEEEEEEADDAVVFVAWKLVKGFQYSKNSVPVVIIHFPKYISQT